MDKYKGWQQRGWFVRQPELLVFDDLASALELETELALWSQIFVNSTKPEQNNWTPTCLVVSHRRSVLRRADQVIVLKAGKVEAQGKFDEIFIHEQDNYY